MKKIILVFGCIIFFLSGKNDNYQKRKIEKRIATLADLAKPFRYFSSGELKKRQAITNDWIMALDSLIIFCKGDKAVMDVYSILNMRREVGTIDRSDKDRLIYDDGPLPELIIVPVYYETEIDSGSYFFKTNLQNCFAYTKPFLTSEGIVQTIFFKAINLSKTYKALLLLHEGKHIFDNGDQGLNRLSLFEKEIEVRKFIHQTVEEIGGKPFMQIINAESKKGFLSYSDKMMMDQLINLELKHWGTIQKIFNLNNVTVIEKYEWLYMVQIEANLLALKKKKLKPAKEKALTEELFCKIYGLSDPCKK